MSASDPLQKLAAVVKRSRHSKDFMIVQPYSVSCEMRVLVRPPKWWQLLGRIADTRLLASLKASVPSHVPVSIGCLTGERWHRILYIEAGPQ